MDIYIYEWTRWWELSRPPWIGIYHLSRRDLLRHLLPCFASMYKAHDVLPSCPPPTLTYTTTPCQTCPYQYSSCFLLLNHPPKVFLPLKIIKGVTSNASGQILSTTEQDSRFAPSLYCGLWLISQQILLTSAPIPRMNPVSSRLYIFLGIIAYLVIVYWSLLFH